jgi:hypothetical protein
MSFLGVLFLIILWFKLPEVWQLFGGDGFHKEFLTKSLP